MQLFFSFSPKNSILEKIDETSTNFNPNPVMKEFMKKLHSEDENIIAVKCSKELKAMLHQTSEKPDLNHKRLVILEFYASWCGLCKRVGPQVSVSELE